ncbi:hypothetical protein AB1Y20_013350 [Prymnesium parvum]|uniref:Uncharacterized protein n=1 Tax=Prymnesium parvum TaxID=97485 RepID=A0AB34IL85_PRYPA
MVGYFNSSIVGVNEGECGLGSCQRTVGVPENGLTQDVKTRWRSTHDMANSLRINQEALILYDVRNPQAAKGFKDNRYAIPDWEINNQTVAVLAPLANASKYLEGKNYPTSNLVLPSIFGCIHLLKPDTLIKKPWSNEFINPADLRPEVSEARNKLHDDLVLRWVTEMEEARKRFYYIATLCDPRQKALRFPGVAAQARETALDWFEAEYISHFSGNDPACAPARAPAAARPDAAGSSRPAHAQHGASSFLDFMSDLAEVAGHATTTTAGGTADTGEDGEVVENEARRYLHMPDAPMHVNILECGAMGAGWSSEAPADVEGARLVSRDEEEACARPPPCWLLSPPPLRWLAERHQLTAEKCLFSVYGPLLAGLPILAARLLVHAWRELFLAPPPPAYERSSLTEQLAANWDARGGGYRAGVGIYASVWTRDSFFALFAPIPQRGERLRAMCERLRRHLAVVARTPRPCAHVPFQFNEVYYIPSIIFRRPFFRARPLVLYNDEKYGQPVMDVNAQYVLMVSEAYRLSHDLEWLRLHAEPIAQSLAFYQLYADDSGLVHELPFGNWEDTLLYSGARAFTNLLHLEALRRARDLFDALADSRAAAAYAAQHAALYERVLSLVLAQRDTVSVSLAALWLPDEPRVDAALRQMLADFPPTLPPNRWPLPPLSAICPSIRLLGHADYHRAFRWSNVAALWAAALLSRGLPEEGEAALRRLDAAVAAHGTVHEVYSPADGAPVDYALYRSETHFSMGIGPYLLARSLAASPFPSAAPIRRRRRVRLAGAAACLCGCLLRAAGVHLLAGALLLYARAAAASAAARAAARAAAAAHRPSAAAPRLNRSYATLVYGERRAAVCEALVLGAALDALDPAVPRTALVANLSAAARRHLSHRWRLVEGGAAGGARAKSALWRLPYEKVFYLDADHLPLTAGDLAARRARFDFAWRADAPLLAAWELPHPWLASLRARPLTASSRCFNGGALLLRPDEPTARRIAAAEALMRAADAAGFSSGPKGQEATDAPQFARCPQGSDQPPLNLAVQSFASLPLAQLSPLVPCALSPPLAAADTFHAFTGLTPLRLGEHCEAHAVLSGAKRCELPADTPTHKLFRAFGCADNLNSFAVEWWRLFRTLPRGAQDYCAPKHARAKP